MKIPRRDAIATLAGVSTLLSTTAFSHAEQDSKVSEKNLEGKIRRVFHVGHKANHEFAIQLDNGNEGWVDPVAGAHERVWAAACGLAAVLSGGGKINATLCYRAHTSVDGVPRFVDVERILIHS